MSLWHNLRIQVNSINECKKKNVYQYDTTDDNSIFHVLIHLTDQAHQHHLCLQIKQPAEHHKKYKEFCYTLSLVLYHRANPAEVMQPGSIPVQTQCLACIFFPCVGMLTKKELLISDSFNPVQQVKCAIYKGTMPHISHFHISQIQSNQKQIEYFLWFCFHHLILEGKPCFPYYIRFGFCSVLLRTQIIYLILLVQSVQVQRVIFYTNTQ